MAHVQRKCSRCRRSVPAGARACPVCASRNAAWVARYMGPDHREHSRSGFTRKSDAENYAAAQETDKHRGAWIDPALGRITFDQWADEWLCLKAARKPKTRAGYVAILGKHLRPRFGHYPIAGIRPEDVSRFVAELQASGMGSSTIRNVYRVLSNAMRLAVVNRRIPQTPCVIEELPQASRREKVVLTAQEVERLADATPQPYGALVTFAAYSGLRWGEIVALRVGRCDLLRSTIEVMESASEVEGGIVYVSPKNGGRGPFAFPARSSTY